MQRTVIIMPKGKVKVEITSTYYFTPEQWRTHEEVRTKRGTPLNEYLDEVCPPQQSSTQVDMSQLATDEGESGYKQGVLFG